MTKERADGVLVSAAESVRAAIDSYRSLMVDARENIDRLTKAWEKWDVEVMEDMGVLTSREAERVVEALEVAEE